MYQARSCVFIFSGTLLYLFFICFFLFVFFLLYFILSSLFQELYFRFHIICPKTHCNDIHLWKKNLIGPKSLHIYIFIIIYLLILEKVWDILAWKLERKDVSGRYHCRSGDAVTSSWLRVTYNCTTLGKISNKLIGKVWCYKGVINVFRSE